MSAKAPSLILDKWFRWSNSLLLADEPTQFFDRVMGSAHTHKCLHTGRNPVCCRKPNHPAKLDCFSGEALAMSGASCREVRASNYLILLWN